MERRLGRCHDIIHSCPLKRNTLVHSTGFRNIVPTVFHSNHQHDTAIKIFRCVSHIPLGILLYAFSPGYVRQYEDIHFLPAPGCKFREAVIKFSFLFCREHIRFIHYLGCPYGGKSQRETEEGQKHHYPFPHPNPPITHSIMPKLMINIIKNVPQVQRASLPLSMGSEPTKTPVWPFIINV